MDFPASYIATLQEQIGRLGRAGVTNIVRFQDLVAAVPVAVGVVPGEAPALPLTFQESGFIIGLYGQERTGTPAKFAATEVRLQINGTYDVITAGDAGPAFFPMLAFFGPNVNWFALTARVQKRDIFQATYRNFDTAAVANPTMGFAFLSDRKVAEMVRELHKG